MGRERQRSGLGPLEADLAAVVADLLEFLQDSTRPDQSKEDRQRSWLGRLRRFCQRFFIVNVLFLGLHNGRYRTALWPSGFLRLKNH